MTTTVGADATQLPPHLATERDAQLHSAALRRLRSSGHRTLGNLRCQVHEGVVQLCR